VPMLWTRKSRHDCRSTWTNSVLTSKCVNNDCMRMISEVKHLIHESENERLVLPRSKFQARWKFQEHDKFNFALKIPPMLKSVVKVFRPINSAPSTKMQFGIYHRLNRLFNLTHFKFINPLSIAIFKPVQSNWRCQIQYDCV